jgi:quercetin dioxygenase-like cupin family protein
LTEEKRKNNKKINAMLVEKGKYKGMKKEEIFELLRKEGFSKIYVWEDYPGSYYPYHTHDFYSAHIVIDGKIKIRTDDGEFEFMGGDRFDVEKGEKHLAKVGPEGCIYIVAEK